MIFFKNYTDVLYWIAMIGLVLFFAYTKGWIFANFESISAKKAIEMIQNDDNISILDVRTPQEYKQGHLPDSTLIPVDKLEANIAMIQAYKAKKILVYCASGNRSVSASRILKAQGFVPINVKGGLMSLNKNGAEIVK